MAEIPGSFVAVIDIVFVVVVEIVIVVGIECNAKDANTSAEGREEYLRIIVTGIQPIRIGHHTFIMLIGPAGIGCVFPF